MREHLCRPQHLREILAQEGELGDRRNLELAARQLLELSPRNMRLLERVKGIEPSYSAWKAAALPLSYTRARF